MKKPSIEPKKRIFAQCSLSFHPKIPLKHLYFAVVIIGGKTKCVKMNETLNQWKAL